MGEDSTVLIVQCPQSAILRPEMLGWPWPGLWQPCTLGPAGQPLWGAETPLHRPPTWTPAWWDSLASAGEDHPRSHATSKYVTGLKLGVPNPLVQLFPVIAGPWPRYRAF